MTKQNMNISRIVTLLFIMLMSIGNVWAQSTDSYDYDGDGNYETYTVVYLNLSSGNDNNDGSATNKAVKTWAKAYSKLPAYTGTTDADRDAAWDSNIIVVCDAQGSANLFINETTSGNRPATITGVWPWDAEHTTADYVKTNGGRVYLNGNTAHANTSGTATFTSGTTRIGADTKFKYIRFGGPTQYSMLSMYLHDAYFDVGCLTHEMSYNLTEGNGATAGRTAPDIQVYMFANAYVFDKKKTDGGFNDLMKKPVTLTIRSGKFGRILTNRVAGSPSDERFVIANANKPLLCTINIDIDPNTTTGDWNPKKYPDDIAFIAAGMTQGTEFCDVEFNITRGKIATFVGAMQGTNITDADNRGLSASTFIGRTVVNIKPENDDDVVIQRYFAGCQGRYTSGQTPIANVAFYGKSILNMYGGKIVSGAFLSGGGVSGLKYTDSNGTTYYTTDKFIPYVDASASKNYPFMGIKYQTYKADGVLPTLTNMKNGEMLDISTTETYFNIYGGEISGGLYGGSYGEAPQLTADYAIEGAGSHWGNTYVNIYGGKISGGVYGGGYGTTRYYNEAKAANKARFLTGASVYGNTNVNIYGGDISGGIYGGGAGVAAEGAVGAENEFLNIAKVYGNTNVIIDPQILKPRAKWSDPNVPEFTGPDEYWTYTGNIYGGGAKGAVEGNANVVIKGGNITGNVFAGGLGEDGHTDKAKVTGNTEAKIQGGTQDSEYAVYGGAEKAQIDGNTAINLLDGTIGSAYGGGLGTATMAANVTGNTTVTLDGSIVNGYIFGCNNVNGTPQGHAFVDIKTTKPKGTETQEHPYHVLGVYGGGNLAAYEPTDTNEKTEVLIEHCDNSIEDVFGGGNAAAVQGTEVTVWGGQLGRVFAGGNGASAPANVTNDTHVTIHGGTIHEVYGGSNTAGDIGGIIHVDVAEQKYQENDLCPVNVDDLYGGGNLAASNAGHISIGKCTLIDRVFGGANNANVSGDITLNINEGHINNVFGGNNNGGNINGNITVNVDWNKGVTTENAKVGNVYGGGNIAAIDNAEQKSITVNVINATTSGSVFGGGKGKTAVVKADTKVNIGDWNANHHAVVTGNVFGGGDLAAVEGACTVTVRDCSTLITGDLYGGGNAAPVFETNTTMWGGTVAGNLFGGGNGVDTSAETGNPKGAQVGYTHDDTTDGGSGNANTYVYGGTVGVWNGNTCTAGGGVFGGSNSNGNIRGEINLLLDERECTETDPGTQCDLKLKEVYGAGNEAAYAGSGIAFNLGCVSYLGEIYGGAKAADLNADAILNITSGTFGKVFGGNNMSGKLNGSITINIDETGCHPVIIDELYGGGNLAAYSVYGYEDDGTPKTSGTAKADPQVNIISCTEIGTVFGGGYGETAVMVGNPSVNINQIPGLFANQIDADGNGEADNNANLLGAINTVFGGGNAAKVIGTTTVNVGTLAQNAHLTTPSSLVNAGANITGNVYGGGNQADVTGKTNVTVGR